MKKSEERVAAIRDLLIDYRFDARVEAALREKLASDGIAPYPVITVLKTPWDAAEAQNTQDMPLHAMVITPCYSMDAGFTRYTLRGLMKPGSSSLAHEPDPALEADADKHNWDVPAGT